MFATSQHEANKTRCVKFVCGILCCVKQRDIALSDNSGVVSKQRLIKTTQTLENNNRYSNAKFQDLWPPPP